MSLEDESTIDIAQATLRKKGFVIVSKICNFSCINERLKWAEMLLWVVEKFLYSLEHCGFWGTSSSSSGDLHLLPWDFGSYSFVTHNSYSLLALLKQHTLVHLLWTAMDSVWSGFIWQCAHSIKRKPMFYGYLTVPSVSPELSQFVHCCLYATTTQWKLVIIGRLRLWMACLVCTPLAAHNLMDTAKQCTSQLRAHQLKNPNSFWTPFWMMIKLQMSSSWEKHHHCHTTLFLQWTVSGHCLVVQMCMFSPQSIVHLSPLFVRDCEFPWNVCYNKYANMGPLKLTVSIITIFIQTRGQ